MKESNSQILVICLAISLIIGCFIPGFTENSKLVVAVTLSALAFIFVDLSIFLKVNKIYSYLFLFIAIFSISVLPHIDYFYSLLSPLNNFFTIFGLAMVIGLLGGRQYLEEREFLKKTKKNLTERDKEFNELIALLEEQQKEIEILKEKVKDLSK